MSASKLEVICLCLILQAASSANLMSQSGGQMVVLPFQCGDRLLDVRI